MVVVKSGCRSQLLICQDMSYVVIKRARTDRGQVSWLRVSCYGEPQPLTPTLTACHIVFLSSSSKNGVLLYVGLLDFYLRHTSA